MIEAASEGCAQSLEYLLDHGASVEAMVEGGMTALISAAAAGYQRCLQLLVSRGADVSKQGVMGLTALHLAAERGYIGCATVLAGGTNGAVAAKIRNTDGVLPIQVR